MSIKSSIERSLDDNLRPSQKSYSKCKLDFKLIDVNLYRNKKDRSEAEERLVRGELTIETIKELILIRNVMSEDINLWQIRDILNDIGFNTDADLVETYSADLNAVYNFEGYLIPYYKQIIEMICKNGSKFRKLLLYKLAPGKSRLHIRLFDIGMGQWLASAHIDHVNWMNFLKLKEIIITHLEKGRGDYILGTKLMYKMLNEFNKAIEKDEVFEIDADEILKRL